MLSNIKFIFSAIIIFVLMFCAVVSTVLNMYNPTYKVTIGETFVGYFDSENHFEDVYNTLYTEKEATNENIKIYLDSEPEFEESYIRDSIIYNQNVYTALRNNLKTEYTTYKVKAEKETLTFANEDDATAYVAKLKKELPKADLKIEIVEEKTKELVEPTTVEVANNLFDDIVDRNKPVETPKVVIKYPTTSGQTSSGANSAVANVAAAQGGIWPTAATYITSHFGWRSLGWHTGIDIAGPQGKAIYAYKTGKVVFSGWGGAYGYMLKVDHGNGVATWYAHCSKLLAKAGDTVNQGQTIAHVGTTGNSSGPHLHFEIRINGSAVNPYPYIK